MTSHLKHTFKRSYLKIEVVLKQKLQMLFKLFLKTLFFKSYKNNITRKIEKKLKILGKSVMSGIINQMH